MHPVLILGGGLAGVSLAWQLHWRGVPFSLLDRGTGDGSSRVAGGLITPITGQRHVASWRFDELFPIAEAFYRRVEAETSSQFFHRKRAVRLLDGDDLEMDAAHLDPSAFLDASAELFRPIATEIDVAREVELRPDGVELPRLGLSGRSLIFCQGDFGRNNPWFDAIPFHSAKGEILTLKIPGLGEERILHHGVWLLPLGNDTYRVGSTYRRAWADVFPTDEGREEILAKLRQFVKLPFEVVGHHAGIRPILQPPSRPMIGFHPHHPRLGFFNGLGSKGCLLAPYFSGQLADMLTGDADPLLLPIGKRERIRPTEEVHRLLRETLRPDEVAIDATAGNGQDTLVLADCVGPLGHVHAFDVQEEALKRTRVRLDAEGIANVTLHHRSHAEMRSVLPPLLMGGVGAVVFNLGYLPRGEKAITTRPDSTEQALKAALELLRPGGILTVVAYAGHPGGVEETEAVRRLLSNVEGDEYEVTETPSDPERSDAPRLFVVRK